MGTFGYESLRFPVSFAAGLTITTTLFWGLWSFTDKEFPVVKTTDIKIDFTRQQVDEPPQADKRVKPVLEEIKDIDIDLPFIGPGVTEIGPPTAWMEPTAVVPPGGIGIAMGRDTNAVPLVRVNPTYPPREAQRGTEGWVRVQFDITATGAVTNVVAVESEPEGTGFDKAATDAVARWRYNPSITNGQAVERIGMQTLIRFTLEGEE